MIVLFNCGGRTGNQLFQISHAISYRMENEWLISIGFGATRSLLVDSLKRNWLDIDNRILRALVGKVIYPFIYHVLMMTGFASSHYERNNRCVVRSGKLRRLTIMRGEFESFARQAPDLAQHFRLRESVLSKARPIFDSLPPGSLPIFVHIRRSDFRLLARMLPDQYYLDAMRLFRDRHPNSFFIVVGDDPEHAESMLCTVDSKMISRMSAFEDLALMALCEGGILSNSTFAWWGAFFGKGRLGYVAPRFWSGWASREWRPPEIRANFMTDILEVQDRSR